MKKVNLKAKFSRRFPDPLNKEDQDALNNIEHHVLLCRAIDMPLDIPTDPNPRVQRTDKTIYKRVRESLLQENDPTFHLKNKGITIIAHSVNALPNKEEVEVVFHEGDGIVDGAHTYKIILENKQECPENQYVKLEILTGIPQFMVEFIAEGLNTAVQVQEMSLANLGKRFDWIGEILQDTPYKDCIAYKENQDGDFTIREIISLMTLFNIDKYPDESIHPKIAYTSKASCLEDYLANETSYKKIGPILKDILELYDYVNVRGWEVYTKDKRYRNTPGGRMPLFYQRRERGKYKLTFTGMEVPYKLFDGALYPILGAFRFLVQEDPKAKVYRWKVGGLDAVKKFFDQVGAELISRTKNTSDDSDKNPNAIGKDDTHWDNLYKTVALAYLMKK